jgi:hypothetical protein
MTLSAPIDFESLKDEHPLSFQRAYVVQMGIFFLHVTVWYRDEFTPRRIAWIDLCSDREGKQMIAEDVDINGFTGIQQAAIGTEIARQEDEIMEREKAALRAAWRTWK